MHLEDLRLFIFCITFIASTQLLPTESTLIFSDSKYTMDGSNYKYKTLILDMDGVLAEVSQSYRAAIVKTCHQFGASSVDFDMIAEWKARGNANDDWKLSRDLIISDANGRKDVSLEEVTEAFEKLYQGNGDIPGLCTLETLIPSLETLFELKRRSKPGIGIVTGRPRKDCMKFLQRYNLEELISASYCMEDGPSKPDPYPMTRCCELLGIEPGADVILVGDTPDDIRAATSAGCTGVGVITPEAAKDQEAKGEPYSSAMLGKAMCQVGADVILRPGFAELVDMFPPAE
jgi:HAD superfamily hydrolase (TIGR01548 family)